jgi:two-component system, OmpR family, sensor histidine kinase MprB
MSLRRRLILLCAAAVAVAICIAAVGSYVAVRGELRGQIDDALEANADALQRITGPEGPGSFERGLPARVVERLPKRLRERAMERLPGGGNGPDPPLPPGATMIVVQGISPGGKVGGPPARGPSLPVTSTDRQVAQTGEGRVLEDREVNGDHLRVLTAAVGRDGAVQFARSLEGVDDVLARLRIVLALIVAGGIGLAALLAWLVSRRVIAPITELTEAAEHVSETDDLSRRIEISRGDEVGRLATRFNAMLDTLRGSREALAASVEAQRQLVADASHELRTPVASLRTDIETLIEHPYLLADDRVRILTEIDRRIEELGALIADVIELARGDHPDGAVEDVRLDELVADAVVRMRRMAPGRVFETRLEPCVVEARPDRLARAINNLLDNARKYGPDATPIEVSVANGELVVRDHGPGIPARELNHVFDRFYRGHGARGESGSGLGLAIVRQVAEAHEGEVGVENAPSGGAVFRFWLPASPPSANGDGTSGSM